ncbi:MAG TPA: hypothetical protein VF043_29905 [Ktedonobacteraceae bacterium]
MRVYQLQASIFTGCRSLTNACQSSQQEQRAGKGRPAVPNLPGRANRHLPYPPSRRRRRR